MAIDPKHALRTLNPRKVWIPIILGLGIVVFIALRDDSINQESLLAIGEISGLALAAALACLLFKDFMNTLRVKTLGAESFSLAQSLRIVFLWEFALAVVPPLIGPIAVVIFIIHKHGVGIGKAVAFAMLLALLDNFFFLTASPLFMYLTEGEALPNSAKVQAELGGSLSYFFYLSIGVSCFYFVFMMLALLIFPSFINRLLIKIANWRYLRRWKLNLTHRAEELLEASKEFRHRKMGYWIKLVLITYAVWLTKFAVLNIIIAGFVPLTFDDHILIMGRHLTMWVMMLVSPTPGSAGTAEYIFPAFFEQFLGNYSFGASLVWRFITYYPYLIIGALILPAWIRRIFGHHADAIKKE